MSPGITNPCAYIDQPARALAFGTDRPAHASQRNNHYFPTIRKAGPRGPVVKAKACTPSRVEAEARRPTPSRRRQGQRRGGRSVSGAVRGPAAPRRRRQGQRRGEQRERRGPGPRNPQLSPHPGGGVVARQPAEARVRQPAGGWEAAPARQAAGCREAAGPEPVLPPSSTQPPRRGRGPLTPPPPPSVPSVCLSVSPSL